MVVFTARSKGRWDNKSPFNSVLTQQHLCNKLPYQNRLMCVEVIVCYIIVVFLRHGVQRHMHIVQYMICLLSVRPSVRLSVCHTRVLLRIEKVEPRD